MKKIQTLKKIIDSPYGEIPKGEIIECDDKFANIAVNNLKLAKFKTSTSKKAK